MNGRGLLPPIQEALGEIHEVIDKRPYAFLFPYASGVGLLRTVRIVGLPSIGG